MRKIVLGMLVFALTSFMLSLNSAYALKITVQNKYNTDIEIQVARGSTQWKDMVWNVVDPFPKFFGMSSQVWWKSPIGKGKTSDHDDVGGDSNTINQILIKFINDNTVTLIDPQLPGQVGATAIAIIVQQNGDIDIYWKDTRLKSTQLDDSNTYPLLDPAAAALGHKTLSKKEKFSKYNPNDPDYNGGLRVKDYDEWITIKELTSEHLGFATGVATVKNNSKYYKVLLRGVDQDGRIKKEEWWWPGETKSFDFTGGLAKKVQCLQTWIAPKCQQNDNACNSSKEEKTPVGWGKWEKSCTNIEFTAIRKSGGGSPDRLGLR